MFSVSITHHSKVRELSDENKNWKQKSNRLLNSGTHIFWVMGDRNIVMDDGNTKTKQPLIFFTLSSITMTYHYQVTHESLLKKVTCERLYKLSFLKMRFLGSLICVFKQQFSVFKQHFTHFHTLFHLHVFSQKFLNNNFQFLNTCTKQALKSTYHKFII